MQKPNEKTRRTGHDSEAIGCNPRLTSGPVKSGGGIPRFNADLTGWRDDPIATWKNDGSGHAFQDARISGIQA